MSKSKIIHIDTSGLLQGQASVQVITLNALDLTQALLLKEELRGCIILNDGVDLFFDEAKKDRCIGGEACCNARWKEIAYRNRRRNGKPTLFLNYSADAMIAGGEKTLPGVPLSAKRSTSIYESGHGRPLLSSDLRSTKTRECFFLSA